MRSAVVLSTHLCYRVGSWQQTWAGDRLLSFQPLEEVLALAPAPLFIDVTSEVSGRSECSSASFSMACLTGGHGSTPPVALMSTVTTASPWETSTTTAGTRFMSASRGDYLIGFSGIAVTAP